MVQETNMTAVEWLKEQLYENGSGIPAAYSLFFEQAKQMEKEQIANAWDIGRRDIDYPMNGEQYYNKIYTQSGTE